MKLKQLELIGFKSFAEKVSFELDGAFTGLVGPNGSGKSNVVDALKWVLGEQSARKLRGNEMADMIFHGSDSRRAPASAEVKVTLDNQQGLLPVEYEEVCISRRCFRSGESTYSLNGKNCRLKEIRNLLLDTGVGVSAYSIIEQGQVDMLLQASSKERRAVLEEAAGISRYLEQKKEAERKLQRVRGNLQRVTDIIEELERQLRSVRRQAAKARRYKRHKDRWLRLKLSLALWERAQLLKQKTLLDKTLTEAIECATGLGRRMEDLRGEITRKQSALECSRRELAAVEEKISHLDARIYSIGKEKEFNVNRKTELQDRIQKMGQRYRQLRDNASSVGAELGNAEKNLHRSAEALDNTKARIHEVKADLGDAEKQHRQAYERVEQAKNAMFTLMQQQSDVQNQINMLQSEMKTLGNRLRRNTEREQALHDKRRALELQSRGERNRLESVQNKLHTLHLKDEDLEDKLSKARLELGRLTSDMGDVKAELHGKVERKQVLEDLQERADGVGSGVKLLMDEIKRGSGPLSGCPGMLGNLINVSTKYARAVEAALGSYVQAVVLHTEDQARYSLELLKKNGKGRAYVIALEKLQQIKSAPGKPGSQVSPSTALADLVDCSESIENVLDSLIGNCYVIGDLSETAVAPFVSGPAGAVRLVTRSGDLFDSNGVWAAGNPESGGFISRRSELTELAADIEGIRRRLSGISDAAGRCSQRVEQFQSSRRALTAEKEQLQKKEQDAGNRISVLDTQKKQVDEEIKVLKEDAGALETEREEAEDKLGAKNDEARALAVEKRAKEESLSETQGLQGRLRDRCDALRESRNALENKRSRLEEQHKAAEALLARLNDQLEQNEDEIERLEEERRSCNSEIEKTDRAIGKAASDSAGLKAERDSLEEKTLDKRRDIDQLTGSLEAARGKADGVEGKLRSAEERVRTTQMAENENRLKMENLQERIAEECGINLAALELVPEQWRDTPLYTDAEIEEYCILPEEMAPSQKTARWYVEECKQELRRKAEDDSDAPALVKLEDAVLLQREVFAIIQSPCTEWGELKQEAHALRGKLERMGGANLEAIREQDELEIRSEFLTNQREDLEKARRHELEIIRELSKKSRDSFVSTFESVRQNFQIIIRKLFGGGSGDLILEQDTEDVLEAGIEISVRPPGKETRSISLLSGGEKALAAVALLFAIFESKPSPFCLLDEVDAPLDEANVGRFLGLLEQYTANTQFVIVTHNKLTMSAAETLYGVSMDQDGTSKKVTINFEEVDRQLQEMEHETTRARAG